MDICELIALTDGNVGDLLSIVAPIGSDLTPNSKYKLLILATRLDLVEYRGIMELFHLRGFRHVWFLTPLGAALHATFP